jgi:hypothetical protein
VLNNYNFPKKNGPQKQGIRAFSRIAIEMRRLSNEKITCFSWNFWGAAYLTFGRCATYTRLPILHLPQVLVRRREPVRGQQRRARLRDRALRIWRLLPDLRGQATRKDEQEEQELNQQQERERDDDGSVLLRPRICTLWEASVQGKNTISVGGRFHVALWHVIKHCNLLLQWIK